MVEQFVDDDRGYVSWLNAHPRGYVISCHRNPDPWLLRLHRVRCIRELAPQTGDFRRVCGDTAAELVEWAEETVGSEPESCERCHPA